MRPTLKLMLTTALALVVTASPAAAATFVAHVGSGATNAVNCPSGDVVGSGPVSKSSSCADAVGVINASAVSGFGHLGAGASALTLTGSGLPAQISGQAAFSDVLVFTSSDPSATSASVSLNMLLDGMLVSAANAAAGGQASARVEGVVQFGGGFFQFIFANSTDNGFFTLNHFGSVSGSVGPAMDAVLTTSAVTVPLNQQVLLSMSIEAGALADGSGGSAGSDFSGSFKLPTGSDAFNVSDGVTVNAGTWLVNNRFIDPATTAVPEPAAWTLMISGFGLAGAALRRRRALAAG